MRDYLRRPRVIASLVLLVLLLIVTLQNIEFIPVQFLWLTFEMRLFFLLLLSASVGFVMGYLIANVRKRR